MTNTSTIKKVRLNQRMSKAFFNGMGLGLMGGAAIYILAEGVNILAGTPVLNSTAFMVMAIGGMMTSSIGIELSKDIDEG